MKRGFTLLEVLLAVSVMATGVLSVVILYSMGFRETRQSREDVGAAAYADAVMSPLVNAISATNLTWSTFKAIKSSPTSGWADYCDDSTGQVKSNPKSIAQSAFGSVPGASWPSGADGGLVPGLVIRHDPNSSVVKIGFRAARNAGMLLSAPLYYTEVRFQGVQEKVAQ